jgi:farnesyl-diphosphate farnesyltransferase
VKTPWSSTGLTMEEIPDLLRVHARTMSLSLRLLPPALREPLGLAYLLARASDTIADSGRLAAEERVAWLQSIQAALAKSTCEALPPVNVSEAFTPAEHGLLDSLPRLLALLGEMPEREELISLWREILEGQLFDLLRFTSGAAPLNRNELELYCDLVAGSVGRCWTRLIAKHSPRTLLAPVDELLPLASGYGKGLQLLNILRDWESDRAIGRRYVEERAAAEHLKQAHSWLAAADRYLHALAPGRILMASSLPLDLARATLPLVASAIPGERAKLSRHRVRMILAASARSLVLPRRADPV